ncbi:hypothetical protein [Microbaculum marinum]|uniref:Uncharacterized protein n=1 Tax=Microbaculum marinum TaxID=1764581 RepID=A0AAW9RN32_9HYPH
MSDDSKPVNLLSNPIVKKMSERMAVKEVELASAYALIDSYKSLEAQHKETIGQLGAELEQHRQELAELRASLQPKDGEVIPPKNDKAAKPARPN